MTQTNVAPAPAPANDPKLVALIRKAAAALSRHCHGLAAKCSHWTPAITAAIDTALAGCNEVDKLIGNLPDGFKPPRRTNTHATIEIGARVLLRDGVVADFAGIIDTTHALTVDTVGDKICKVTDAKGVSTTVYRKDLKVAGPWAA